MSDERNLDRRSFLRRASAAGLLGIPGLGRSRARQGDGQNGDGTGRGGTGGGQNGDVDYFRAVLPDGELLDASLVYKIIVAGDPIQPGVRPPPLCFPEGEEEWRARDALVVKPTQTSGVFGQEGPIGAVDDSRAYLETPVEPGTVYRISGGEFCDGHARVTVHELPPRLSEYFSTEMLTHLDANPGIVESGTENPTDWNSVLENRGEGESGGNETAGNETAGNERVGN